MKNLNKKEAIERLTAIKEETKQLRKIIEQADAPKNIMERVKTFEDACDVLGVEVVFDESDSKFIMAAKKLEIIYKALNEGWEPNWSNSNEYKYYPWFKMSPFGFDGAGYVFWLAHSNAGSRLCGKTDTIAEYAGRQFEDLYRDFMCL